MKEPYPSGTAVLLKEVSDHFEILLVRRNTKLSFHGGAWVFPGGRVDQKDFPTKENDIVSAAKNAAVRETMEEAGVEIYSDNLVLMSRWTTPEGLPKRFTAWFFVTAVKGDSVKIDGEEISDYRWMRPASALDAHGSGEIVLPPPTFVTLLKLSDYGNVKTALLAIAKQQLMTFYPKISQTKNGSCFLYEGDAGYELHDANQPGARHRLWVVEDGYRYERS
ncbi:MAG: NUDIX hydrolase [Deltaproteobacteria bacterium]|nr:NUDIX hydrolase [Deltaproteobacteria bacterium]